MGWMTVRDQQGNTVGKKSFIYLSSQLGIKRSRKEYEADNYKLLAEEIPLAAEYTAQHLILDKLVLR